MSDSSSSPVAPPAASGPIKVQHLSPVSTAVAPVAPPQSAPATMVPLTVDVDAANGPPPIHLQATDGPKPNRFAQYWRKVGGGSLMVSLLIHAGILIGAVFIVQTIVVEPKVDFLPGGGSKSGAEASQAHTAQVQQKKRNSMQKTTPMRKVVSNSSTATMTLPDLPMDTIDMPEVSSMLGGAMGSGGFGGGGFGGGSGAGFGSGNVKGFLARTVFGNLGGGDGIPGVLYDLKQDRREKPINYNANEYFPLLKKFADSKFSNTHIREYFRAPQEMAFTFLAIPLMSADEGPKAFAVENLVQPRGLLVHYTGTIVPPESGEWRWVGYFDDALAVYINNKPVLDASRDMLSNLGEAKPDEEIRQPFNGRVLNGQSYAGKWVRLNGPAKIDIIMGERPGGQIGGLLMVQHERTKYKKRENGTPILPLFLTAKPDIDDLNRMKKFAEGLKGFGLETEQIPIFNVTKSAFDPDKAKSNLLPRRPVAGQ